MKYIVSIGLSIVLLSGCGAEIAYKRGASARDLQVSKAACDKASDEKALEKCLEDNGWAIQKLDGSGFSDDELFATASVTEDNRMAAPSPKKPATIQTTESLKAEEVVTKSDEKTKLPVTAPTNKSTKPRIDTSRAATPNKPTTTTRPTSKPKPSLFDTYVIKSWWKMGGTPSLLESNMNECTATLGEAHTPNKKTFTFTRAFVICLREKGWRGLIDRK